MIKGRDVIDRLIEASRILASAKRQESAVEKHNSLNPQGSDQMLDIGILWCTFFQSRGIFHWPWRDLPDAYRPPSFFLSMMRAAGHHLEFEHCDEHIPSSRLYPALGTIPLQDRVHLLYVMTHGKFSSSGYEACLYTSNWVIGNAALGNAKLVVAVFDTCELIKGSNWASQWQLANLGTHIRLLLGADGSLAIDRGSALRGRAFAENLLHGKTFADAWIQAVHHTTNSQYKKAVAIGIGDSVADAENVLDTASLTSLPPPRSGTQPYFRERY
jgi:hypothetical protein